MSDHTTAVTHAADAASAISSKGLAITMTGGGTLFFGGLTTNELAMLSGMVVSVVGLALQWYYRHKEYQMRRREHEISLEAARTNTLVEQLPRGERR